MTKALFGRQSVLVDQLTAKGFRLTSQRRVLLEIIQEAEGHLDAATLLQLARQRDANIDRATVYRTLDLLKKLGLVDELDLMHLNGEKHYYEAKPARDHVHLACFQCGRIQEFSSVTFERLKQEIAREDDFEIRVVRMEVGGRCGTCRAGKTNGDDITTKH
ncbi:MAG: Fur family transcriptional regulator [Bryobacteraceae bacterium]